jgi:hypothetical protein
MRVLAGPQDQTWHATRLSHTWCDSKCAQTYTQLRCLRAAGEAQWPPPLTIFWGVSGLTLMVAAALNSGSSARRSAAASASTKLGMRWCTGRGKLSGHSSRPGEGVCVQ